MSLRGKLKDKPFLLRASFLIVYDILFAIIVNYMALWILYNFSIRDIESRYLTNVMHFLPIYIVCLVLACFFLKLYQSLWESAGFLELFHVEIVSCILLVVNVFGTKLLNMPVPRSCYFLVFVLQFFALAGLRFSYRAARQYKDYLQHYKNRRPAKRVMLIGGGKAGEIILKDLTGNKDFKVCCIIDDNPKKLGVYVKGVPVVGNRQDIPKMVEKYRVDRIIVAIPSAGRMERCAILNLCKEKTNCELNVMPGIDELVSGKVSISELREVCLEDLLGRGTIQVNLNEIFDELRGKTVLVTGGGGSIGSELCRQIAAHDPGTLVIVDIYENNAYNLQMELQYIHPNLDIQVRIASVRDMTRVDDLFEEFRPDIVYHAAAHKHVPLMEDSPNEAIKNNVFGTLNMAQAAQKYETKKFVLISTDKAVNPTSIMGASKRLCEMIIQMMDRHSWTNFVAVRFGNVLGSNGSVVPLFKEQIARGGPVTVTHPDITRYFMTIPEAVSLVLQAGAYAKGGEIFVLDMGEPVKIDDLARNMIRLSNLKPDVDIKIEYVGLRPGEKLYEETLMDEEGIRRTENQMIYIGSPIQFDEKAFLRQLKLLEEDCMRNAAETKNLICKMVPTYISSMDSGTHSCKQAHTPEQDIKTG